MTCILVIVFTGCTSCAPSGYVRNAPPPIIINGSPGNLISQFPELNENSSFDIWYFNHENEVHYVKSNNAMHNFFGAGNSFSVYNDSNNEHLGNFVIITPIREDEQISLRTVFLFEHHLYYYFIRGVKVSAVFNHQGFIIANKFEFYRFDLHTGENEEISLQIFFESFKAINPSIELR